MFEKFTEKARRVMFFARYEASQFGAESIQSGHLLLGLLREAEKTSTQLLERMGVQTNQLRDRLIGALTPRDRKVVPSSTSIDIPMEEEVKRILQHATQESAKLNHKHVGAEHLLLGMLKEEESLAGRLLREAGADILAAKEILLESTKEEKIAKKKKEHPLLAEFARNLSEMAERGIFDNLIGRDTEVERIIQILSRRRKNNPILLGEAGVGKTAIVEGLAQKIYEGKVPPGLQEKRIYALDLSLVVAGTKYRGQFEERLKAIIAEASKDPSVVLFIDEVHSIIGTGAAEGSLDAANILKPALSRGEIQCIGATTHKEFAKYIDKDRSLVRRFQPVTVNPPDEEESLRILEGIRSRYELFHRVRYTPATLRASVYLANRYITDRFLPDKAIDLLDEAGARVKLRVGASGGDAPRVEEELHRVINEMNEAVLNRDFERAVLLRQKEIQLREQLQGGQKELTDEDYERFAEVGEQDIEDVVASWTGIPVKALKNEEKQNLVQMETRLNERVIGQEPAVSAVSRAVRRARTGLKNPNRPMGSFLFLGPTGVGKTELAKTLATFLFGDPKKMHRFDMSEFMEKHEVSKLLGAPPGYVGYEEGGLLTDRVRRNPYCVLLFDEVEKAHPDLINILLQIFDDGIATDAFGNQVDFKNTIIIMTSNVGSRELLTDKALGFVEQEQRLDAKAGDAMKVLKRTFPPEFLNRIDEIVVFNRLGDAELHKIVRLLVYDLNQTLKQHRLEVDLSDAAVDWIVKTTSRDRSYGARPLRRAIQKAVEDPLAELMVAQDTVPSGRVFFEAGPDGLVPAFTEDGSRETLSPVP
ncbi:ATP-dependent Clp protease ATP-binding subunit [Holophaga foetida]|uniref:ATP-dependent Clp protease ATP-binding subunit n=1 Tax=Holophaga foetida TaxID=35839 RepID=UPI00024753C2|nr:ATP-dependent Clp protease ATP-binding subunit [Holophaga foetida]